MKHVGHRSGFTILELLIVIALLGLVTGMAVSFLHAMNENWDELTDRNDLSRSADDCLQTMRRDFSQILSSELAGRSLVGVARKTHGFEDDSVRFPVLTAASSDGGSVGRVVQYEILRADPLPEDLDGGRPQLVRSESGLTEGELGLAPQTVLEGVVALRFEYSNPDKPGQWQQVWGKATMPRAVRVSLTVADGESQISRKAVFPVPVM
jgi:prepilin-type N-terminal cleavage/methylation domain-containing protein